MIDELFEEVFTLVLRVVPDVVWGFLFILGGVATTAIGVGIFSESARSGGILIAVGVLLVVSVLVMWYR
ncbi:hypothetical protein [Halosolutus halophilus]|uniref:hypothetical protein n=1 Tax=Halosolutus halophilus TaxID=1552990 RepID=UPI0022350114|nr:hypothetical protein [Halosolutus halophilus]